MLSVLDLFSGIGGFSLGLERTGGFKTVAFCEIEPYCRAVLRKHWPDVPCFEDVRTLTAADVGAADVICGGFPCQDISNAGKMAGIEGQRSGLWSEYARLVGELRPSYVIVENVAALLGRGIDRVLGDLAALGFDAEWHCIPASAIGAPHFRDRVWIVAYPDSHGSQKRADDERNSSKETSGQQARGEGVGSFPPNGVCANTERGERSLGGALGRIRRIFQSIPRNRAWKITSEPVLARRADGIPNRLDRLAAIGNAVLPDIPEIIGRAILEAEGIA